MSIKGKSARSRVEKERAHRVENDQDKATVFTIHYHHLPSKTRVYIPVFFYFFIGSNSRMLLKNKKIISCVCGVHKCLYFVSQ